jgi:agmatinase
VEEDSTVEETRELRAPRTPFLGADVVLDTSAVPTPFAFLGIPFGPPYVPEDLTACADAADAVRAVIERMEYGVASHHHDFDLGGPLFADGVPSVTDCGDVVGDPRDPDAIWDRAVGVVRPLVAAGRVPLVLGALDAIPPIVAQAFDGLGTDGGHEPLNVLHVDAHIDFRDEVHGVRRGYSSPIRRIREMPHIASIVQVGLRAVGSGRPADVQDAIDAGNVLVTAWELHEQGIGPLLERLEDTAGRWLVTIDCDGLDPSIAPAVGWPEPGGLTYPQIVGIVRTLAKRHAIAAMVVTEFQPSRDQVQRTAQTIARLLINVIGLQRGR